MKQHIGKVVILTGAGGGIGLAITEQLLSSNKISLLIAIDLRTTGLKQLQIQWGDRLCVLEGNICDRATSLEAVDTAIERCGRLDAVVLNAAMLKPVGPVAEAVVSEWKQLYDVNFFALLHTVSITASPSRAVQFAKPYDSQPEEAIVRRLMINQIQVALPALRKSHGQIIMTSSGVTVEPQAAWLAYASSKCAMNCLAAGVAMEEKLISTICVMPGIVDTGMQATVRDELKSKLPPAGYEFLVNLHAEGKLLQPSQPAKSIARLALDGIPGQLNGALIDWDDSRL